MKSMLRYFFALLAILIWHGPAPAQEMSTEALASRLQGAIVGIAVAPAAKASNTDRPSAGVASAQAVMTDGGVVGAGTLVASDGLILTIASLFDSSGDVTVTLDGGAKFKRDLVGRDRRTGLALLRIDAHNLPFLSASSAGSLALGERVLALGRSRLDSRAPAMITDGVVSLTYDSSMDVAPFIQSTVSILPGMGGGPLVRQKTGEFIGVISQQYVPRVGSPITFATPLDEYLPIADELLKNGRVDRAAIRVQIDQLTEDLAKILGLPSNKGILIRGALDGGPAQRAGVEAGDVVLALDQAEVTTPTAFVRELAKKKPGVPIDLRVFRRGRVLNIQVVGETAQ